MLPMHCSPLSYSATLEAEEEAEGLVVQEGAAGSSAAAHSTFETTCNESRVSGGKR
jgi:hypothetical protein